jgi:hypothetical protein
MLRHPGRYTAALAAGLALLLGGCGGGSDENAGEVASADPSPPTAAAPEAPAPAPAAPTPPAAAAAPEAPAPAPVAAAPAPAPGEPGRRVENSAATDDLLQIAQGAASAAPAPAPAAAAPGAAPGGMPGDPSSAMAAAYGAAGSGSGPSSGGPPSGYAGTSGARPPAGYPGAGGSSGAPGPPGESSTASMEAAYRQAGRSGGSLPGDSSSGAAGGGSSSGTGSMEAAYAGGSSGSGSGGAAAGEPDYTTAVKGAETFLAAVTSKNVERIADALALRSVSDTEGSAKYKATFQAILDRSIDPEAIEQIAANFKDMKIVGTNSVKSSGSRGIIIGRTNEKQEFLTRTLTMRREKAGWKVLDLSGIRVQKSAGFNNRNQNGGNYGGGASSSGS